MSPSFTGDESLSREAFFSEYGVALVQGTAAVFAGAGLSRAAGYLDWKGLLREIAEEMGLNIEFEPDLVAVAQYHVNSNTQDRSRLNAHLHAAFSEDARPTASHHILARLPIHTYWTTNYDSLIEEALKDAQKRPDIKSKRSSLATTRKGALATVYKMHGDERETENVIISRDDYENYARNHGDFLVHLRGDLSSKTFLFLGFSFSDPNLDHVLGQVRASCGNSPRTHYTVMRKEQPEQWRSQQETDYAIRKQALRIADLKRYGIHTVLINEWSEVPALLEELERRYLRRHIFVSGAAGTHTEPFGKERLEKFVSQLGKRIINHDYNLVNGFGLGIGAALITGALEAAYADDQTRVGQRLLLRPFPLGRPDLYTKYRKEMLEGVGFIILITGTKLVDETPILSPGCREEYELARARGVYPIPIGATGGVAEQVWNEIAPRLTEVYPGQFPNEAFNRLNDKSLNDDTLLDAAFELIHYLTPKRWVPPRR
ncbi:hypothetical protein D7V80_28840 [Corallococcus sp. CA054B]|uniref:SIR2 family protein n=1 Tax=Corallococcus sp. CA054B TaxID=2316734 RepID=UPI000EA06A02|nr:SIR2 family protein [Corallococcus sp. CA054B]RKG63927.1 hypothetical protein D7V80_28840 [Corallococcus sp. CA054B]